MPNAETEKPTLLKLALIAERAQQEPNCQFTSLAHLLDERFLEHCYHRLGRDRASGNMPSLQRYYRLAMRLALKWLNRRSQRRSFSWAGFDEYLKHYPLPKPRIVHNLYTLSPVT